MLTPFRAVLVGSVCLVATGAVAESRATYRCEGGVTIRVRFPDEQTAILALGGKTYRLKNTMAASGARYAGSGISFWDYHGEATLERGGKSTSCKALS